MAMGARHGHTVSLPTRPRPDVCRPGQGGAPVRPEARLRHRCPGWAFGSGANAGRPPRAPPPSHAGRIRAARSRWPPERRSVLSSPSGGPATRPVVSSTPHGRSGRRAPGTHHGAARRSRGEVRSFRAGPGAAAPSGPGDVRGDTGSDVRRDTGSDTVIRGRRPFSLLSPGFSGGEWPDFLFCCPSCPWWLWVVGGGGGARNGRALGALTRRPEGVAELRSTGLLDKIKAWADALNAILAVGSGSAQLGQTVMRALE